MEIIGYSERGAMNALFYGMAFNNDDDAMRNFLALAEIEDGYTNFRLYMECSLSDFGSPDLVIIADRTDGKGSDVFFIEAKVSEGVYFDLYVHKSKHKEDKYDASNLFFQLRSKEYFFNHECKGFEEERYKDNSFNIIKFKKGTTIDREIGANVVVNKFVEIIKECNSAYYIAIIPKQTKEIDMDKEFGFPIRFVTWEEILEKMNLYISKNINFNNKKGKNQILNNPK